ncbi:MAG: marine proteobacterial sortase target protein [Sphingorhabdus sp.]
MSSSVLISTPKAVLTRCFLSAASVMLALPAGAVLAAPAFASHGAQASEDAGPGSGALMLRTKDGDASVPAIRLGTDMTVDVSGNIARVRVTQVFRNVSKDWVEATYLYPLPENAAVDSLKMTVGQRVIIGKIKQREEAREIYEQAKAEGKKAGLVEQLRPNMFVNKVANVGPGETVLVVIEYQMPLKQLDGTFALRLPLVVGARYVPPHTLVSDENLDDAKAITAAPVADPNNGKINPVSINIDLAPGFVPANIESAYHKVSVGGKGVRRHVTLAKGQVPQDRDFELSWRSASASPRLSLFREEVEGKHYIMASITPPVQDEKSFIPPREMIFVIDNSGSMMGESMDEAKASLIHALGTLRPQDHFNIIRFDDTMELVFEQSVAATQAHIASAKAFTEALEADGGTEMLPALKAALADHGVTERAKIVRQVIFLTDGDISNEQEMLAAIAADAGSSRVFTVGIGSAPNNYLMSRMATTGRGIYTNIGDPKEVTVKMAELLDMLSRPSVQDLKVSVTGGSFDLTPKMLPDLYAGEPLVLLGLAGSLEGTVTVSGRIGKKRWKQSLDVTSALASPSVAKLWARRRIDDIEADRILGGIEDNAADAEITKIGLEFHIVTSMTSLVAVDETPSRPEGTALREEDLPINLPKGWDFDHLFGGESARAAMANEAALAKMAETKKFKLPQTATNYMVSLFGGLLALLIGLFGLVTLRSRKEV